VQPDALDAAGVLSAYFVQAMRGFAGAVCVVTVADGDERSGFTATSVSSFSAQPPMVVASMKATSSSAGLLERTRRFGVNLLRAEQRAIAERFTGFRDESAPRPLVYWQGQYTALAGALAATG
jgi:flavin reductase (DIM6/NTAB) family NADH-FMN oxidoreductase RutF